MIFDQRKNEIYKLRIVIKNCTVCVNQRFNLEISITNNEITIIDFNLIRVHKSIPE